MLDVSGLKLYPFEVHTGSLEELQIPEDFLHGMPTKELFYQMSRFERIGEIIAHAYAKRINFTSYISMFNMFAEFLKRPDAPHLLIQLLQRMDPAFIRWGDDFPHVGSVDCMYFYDCVQVFASHPDIINRMTEDEINRYINEQIRLYNKIRDMDKIENGLEFPRNTCMGLYGLCNIMLRYEFKPFMQLMEEDENLNNMMLSEYGTPSYTVIYHSLIIELIEQFKKMKK
jgi:hypothetical protein